MQNSKSIASPPVLSRTADYALRAILVLARRGARPLAAESIAELTGSPPNYTSKTLNALTRAGLLRSMRGPTGGFVLAVPPEQISVARIAEVFAEAVHVPHCLLGTGPCNPESPCAAHAHWTRLTQAAREPLLATTVADLLAAWSGESRPKSRLSPDDM